MSLERIGLGRRAFRGVEGDAGVSLFVDTDAGEAAVAFRGLESFAGVLGEDESVRAQQLGMRRAAEKAESLGVLVFRLVGWVEKDDVDRVGQLEQARQQRGDATVFYGVPARYPELSEIGAEGFEGGRRLFGEEGGVRAA